MEYWGREICIARQTKRQKCKEMPQGDGEVTETNEHDDTMQNIASLTVKQLREMVKSRGLKPRGLTKLKKSQLVDLIKTS